MSTLFSVAFLQFKLMANRRCHQRLSNVPTNYYGKYIKLQYLVLFTQHSHTLHPCVYIMCYLYVCGKVKVFSNKINYSMCVLKMRFILFIVLHIMFTWTISFLINKAKTSLTSYDTLICNIQHKHQTLLLNRICIKLMICSTQLAEWSVHHKVQQLYC